MSKICRSLYPSYHNTCIILISSQQINEFKEANYFFLKPLTPSKIQSQIELFWQSQQVDPLEDSDKLELIGDESA
ncbi:MAG: hypothetical protein AAF673_03595 [Pseudomonadota bacterium]